MTAGHPSFHLLLLLGPPSAFPFRPVADLPGGLAGPGRARDPDPELSDPSALAAVLDEQYHWVPARALQVGRG